MAPMRIRPPTPAPTPISIFSFLLSPEEEEEELLPDVGRADHDEGATAAKVSLL